MLAIFYLPCVALSEAGLEQISDYPILIDSIKKFSRFGCFFCKNAIINLINENPINYTIMNKNMLRKAGSGFAGKKLLFAAPLLVLLAAGCGSSSPQSANSSPQNNTPPAAQTENKQGSQTPAGQTGNVWIGLLKNSDNAKKGNLMLATKNQTIYIKTSRDYSTLVGQQASVSYEGTSDNFVLGDIVAAGTQINVPEPK